MPEDLFYCLVIMFILFLIVKTEGKTGTEAEEIQADTGVSGLHKGTVGLAKRVDITFKIKEEIQIAAGSYVQHVYQV